MHPSILSRIPRGLSWPFALLLCTTIHAQVTRSACSLPAQLMKHPEEPVLLCVSRDHGDDGWVIVAPRIEDGKLIGHLRELHPQTIYDLRQRFDRLSFCEGRACDLVYGLPERFALVVVQPGVLDGALHASELRLPLTRVHRSFRCRARHNLPPNTPMP
jgi:hypothetical protein